MMEMKKYFSDLVDSRVNRGLRHTLADIVVMSIYAVLCGYTDAENMAFFMKLQEPYFEKILDLKYGTPSADTLLRVFAIIEPEKFMEMFYHWILFLMQKRKYKISQDIDYLMKLDKRFDKKKKMTYEKMSMLYTYHLEYVQELIFEKIAENI